MPLYLSISHYCSRTLLHVILQHTFITLYTLHNLYCSQILNEKQYNKDRSKMMALINRILDWIKSKFWTEEMELTLVGLQCSGKTTFVHVIAVSKLYNNFSINHFLFRIEIINCLLAKYYQHFSLTAV